MKPMQYVVCLGLAIFLAACKPTDNKIQGSILGPVDSVPSMTWDFSTSAEYTYDTNYINVSGGSASLKTVNTTFDSASLFDNGMHAGTVYGGGSLVLLDRAQSPGAHVTSILPAKAANLVGYWRFDGNFTDSSPSAINGIAVNGATTSSISKIGSHAGSFDGISDRIDLGTPNSLKNISQFAIAAWINIPALPGAGTYPHIYAQRSLTDRRVVLGIDGDNPGKAFLSVFDSTGAELYAEVNFAILTNTWVHIVGTYDHSGDKKPRVYINGIEPGYDIQNTLSNPMRDGDTIEISIGDRYGGGRAFNGKIDELAVWNTSLSANEIMQLYQSQSGNYTELSSAWTPKWASLVGYWKMDGNWLDSSGSENHCTAFGGPTFSTPKVGIHSGAFSGTDQTAHCGSSSYLSTFTTMAWIKFSTTPGGNHSIFGRYYGPPSWYSNFWFHAQPNLSLGFSPSGGGWVQGQSSFTSWEANRWYHVAGTWDGTNVKLYIDGQEASLGSDNTGGYTPLNSASADLSIGAFYDSSDGSSYYDFPGNIDETALWNLALSPSEVSLIYNRQKQKYAGSYDSPVIDMGKSGATWTSLVSVTSLPFSKELTGNSGSETSATYSSIIASLMNGVVGLWHMNESSWSGVANEIIDSSGSGFHAIAGGNATTSPFGKLGRSGHFDGLADFATISTQTLSYGNSDFSISFWTNLSAGTFVVGHAGLGQAEGFRVIHTGSGVLRFRIANSMTAVFTDSDAMVLGTWNHFVALRNGNIMSIYRNGKFVSSATVTFNDISFSPNFGFGGRTDGSWSITGDIDEVAIWSRALTDPEVLQVYRRGANRLRYQFRSCVDSTCACKSLSTTPVGSATDCDGDGTPNTTDSSDMHLADWIGSDGTASSYFSELHNNDLINNSTGSPEGNVKNTGLNLDFSLFPIAARPNNNQYFQYKVILESDDENNLCSGSPCMPEVTSISIGPTGRYYGGTPTIVNNTSTSLTKIKTMTKSENNSCTSYQVSVDDGSTWKWWDQTANSGSGGWVIASDGFTSSNSISDLVTSRLLVLGSGNFKFKAYLSSGSNLTQSCEISSVGITYNP